LYREAVLKLNCDAPASLLTFDDCKKLLSTENFHQSIEYLHLIETAAEVEEVLGFDYEMATFYMFNCMQTTFPDHRQKFMRIFLVFTFRLRANYAKDIRKFVSKTPKFDYGALNSEEREALIPSNI